MERADALISRYFLVVGDMGAVKLIDKLVEDDRVEWRDLLRES